MKLNFKNRFTKLEKLGEGTYGEVYKARDKVNQEVSITKIVAIKKIKLFEGEGIPTTTLREISVLKGLSHPNIVKLKEIIYDDEELHLIFEYLEYDLFKFLHTYAGSLSKEDISSIFFQLLCGMNYCHIHQIMHRDLKPQNILIDKKKNVKIADFGLARTFCFPIKTYTHEVHIYQVETLWYRAPEILLGTKEYSLQVDVWSAGCILGEIYNKTPLFRGDSEIDQIFKIFQKFGTPTEKTWNGVSNLKDYQNLFPKWTPKPLQSFIKAKDPDSLDLLEKMLTLNPIKRITGLSALNHNFFRSIR